MPVKPMHVTKPSGSKESTLKIYVPLGTVRYPVDPQKGTNNPPHVHIPLSKIIRSLLGGQ